MRPARRRRRHGQAALEMALVIPVMLALIFNFVGIMVAVEAKAEVSAAVSLAAQATITARVGDVQTSCKNASRAFYDTVFSKRDQQFTPCPPAGSTRFSTTAVPPPAGGLRVTSFGCNGRSGSGAENFLTGSGYPVASSTGPPVTCTARAHYDFSKTPLGFAVLWNPQFDISVIAVPTTARQCVSATGC